MSLLQIVDRDGIQIVDSRLIAAELSVEHRAFLQTLEKYKDKVEQAFGAIAFEMREFKTRQGNVSTERIAYLTEPQATLLMTFSRNSDRVIDCKVALVQAFEKAKNVVSAQFEEIEKLRMQLELAKTQERLLIGCQTLEAIAPGLGQLAMGRPDATVERVLTVEKSVILNDRGQVVHENAGQSPTTVAKSLGMKAAKELKAWLMSIGRLDLLDETQTVISCQHIRTENIQEVKRLWGQKEGERQKVIGEV